MNHYDLTNLIRTTVGFDRLVRMMDSAMQDASPESYPPYNIEKADENIYRIILAVAGFSEQDLKVTVQDNTLYVIGRAKKDNKDVKYLHRGIAGRAFERHFQLADFIKVGEAHLKDGLLSVELIREIPEALKPREISIRTNSEQKQLIHQSSKEKE